MVGVLHGVLDVEFRLSSTTVAGVSLPLQTRGGCVESAEFWEMEGLVGPSVMSTDGLTS